MIKKMKLNAQEAPVKPEKQVRPSSKSRVNWVNPKPDFGEKIERFIQLGDNFDRNWLQKPELHTKMRPVQEAYRKLTKMLIPLAEDLENNYTKYEYDTAILSLFIRHLERPLFTEGAFKELSRLWVILRADIPYSDNLVLRKNGKAQGIIAQTHESTPAIPALNDNETRIFNMVKAYQADSKSPPKYDNFILDLRMSRTTVSGAIKSLKEKALIQPMKGGGFRLLGNPSTERVPE